MVLENAFWVAGILASVLGACAFVPYIRDIQRGVTRPLRSTWLIWATLSVIATATTLTHGVTEAAPFLLVQTTFTVVICLLSLRYGMGGLIHRGEAFVLGLALSGLVLWFVTHDAFWALSISIGVSALGGIATILKTYRHPHTETLASWRWATVAAGIALVSVGLSDPMKMAYTAYLLVLYCGILCAAWLGQRHVVDIEDDPDRAVPLLLFPRQRIDLPANRTTPPRYLTRTGKVA